MEFRTSTTEPTAITTDCLILPLAAAAGSDLKGAAQAIDGATGGLLSRRLAAGDFTGKAGSALMLHEPPGLGAARLLLLGCGSATLGAKDYLKLVRSAAQRLTDTPIATAAFALADLEVTNRDLSWAAQQLARLLTEASYRVEGGKTTAPTPAKLKEVTLLCASTADAKVARPGLAYGSAVAQGVNCTRALGDLPANRCTPSFLAEQAKAFGEQYKSITTKVLNEKQMGELGMGALLSVTAGTVEPAFLLTMEYRGGKKSAKPVVLVGKGVTFDSGGISLKPGAKMDEMKYDMCGAATVFGVMAALVELKLPINVVGIVPTVENMPSGQATRPGDVVKSMSGQTIEILNTDAEGRLILCDALTYAARYKPATVIDIATLTGACVVALGKHASGLFSNDAELAAKLLDAGDRAGDRAWQMPLWEEYDQQLKSPFADMANIGGPEGGSITAASFLARFTKDYRWAHLDIAGTAWSSGDPKGATGRPVPLLMEYLRQLAA